jgi:hypothetical protein
MELTVVPEGLIGASAQVAALTARLIGANAAHAIMGSAIMPPGSDPVSVKTAFDLIGASGLHQVAAAMGNEELARSSLGVGESGASYLIGDGLNGAAFGAAATV